MKKLQSIPVSELRANLMNVLKTVQLGTDIDITSHGKVVARLMPPDDVSKSARKQLSVLRESAELHDVVSPIETEWSAEKT